MRYRQPCCRGRSARAAGTRTHPADATRWFETPPRKTRVHPVKLQAAPLLRTAQAAASGERWGLQVISLATGSEASGCEASLRAAKTRPVPLTCYHFLVGTLPDATGSRHTTRPAHAGVGGHHTTVSPLFFIAYPQTRVPAPSVPGPYAGTAGAGPNPLLDCSPPGPLKSTNPYPISRDLDPGILL